MQSAEDAGSEFGYCTGFAFKGFAVRKDVVGFGGGGGGTGVGLGVGGGGTLAFFLDGGAGTDTELVAPTIGMTSLVGEPDWPELRRDELEKSRHTSLVHDSRQGRTCFPASQSFQSFRYSAQQQLPSLA